MKRIIIGIGIGIIIILLAVSLFSCKHITFKHIRTASEFIKLGKSSNQYESVDDYFDYFAEGKTEIQNDSTWLLFKFLNNPYDLNDDNVISIYVNYHLVYRGIFKELVELKGSPDRIFAKESQMIIILDVLTDKNKKKIWLHRFGSKQVFSWKKDYKIIYCGFFPTNETVENICFIPQSEPMI